MAPTSLSERHPETVPAPLPARPPQAPRSITDLLLKYDRPVPRYTSYPTAAAFDGAVGPQDLADQLERQEPAPLSLYVHVPFCRQACWYCGCHRVVTQGGSKVVGTYLEALAQELALVAARLPRRQRLAQLHWGGGTPNYLNTEETSRLWQLIADHFELDSDLDASIEVNPEFLSRSQVDHLRALGFRRLSFGIQDADPDVQRAVNRVVPVEQLRRVMGWVREADFESVNVDLICGLPRQTPERFGQTLALVQELRPDRLSLFSFAYLPDLLPLQKRIAATDLPDRGQRLRMLSDAHDRLVGDGYAAIGLDHYALKNDSLAIAAREGKLHRNFQGYTTGGELDLLGVGPTAISQFAQLTCQNQRHLGPWKQAVGAGRLGTERGLKVEDPDVLERRALIREVMCHFALSLDLERHGLEWSQMGALAEDGLVRLSQHGKRGDVEVTESGRFLLRTIAAVLDPSQRSRPSGSRLI